MAKKEQYLVIANREADSKELAEAVRETTAVCGTVSMAYRVAKTIGRISKADITYRTCLENLKARAHTEIRQDGDEHEAPARISIFRIKSY